jgi:hypothetical protein
MNQEKYFSITSGIFIKDFSKVLPLSSTTIKKITGVVYMFPVGYQLPMRALIGDTLTIWKQPGSK